MSKRISLFLWATLNKLIEHKEGLLEPATDSLLFTRPGSNLSFLLTSEAEDSLVGQSS